MYEVNRKFGFFEVVHPGGVEKFEGPGAKLSAYAWAQERYREDNGAAQKKESMGLSEESMGLPAEEIVAAAERDFLTDPGPGGSRRGSGRGGMSRGGGA